MLAGFCLGGLINTIWILLCGRLECGVARDLDSKASQRSWQRVAMLLICMTASGTATAYDEPAVNLGTTSFFDGFVPGPGWYFEQYFSYYTADRLTGNSGTALPVTPQHLDATTGVTALTWLSGKKVGGGSFR
jgi:hypothetical protein